MNVIAHPQPMASGLPAERQLALDHLLLRLRPLDRALKLAAEARAGGARLMQAEARPKCLTEQHVRQLFAETGLLAAGVMPLPGGLDLTPEEQRREERLRGLASAQGWTLPLDAMAGEIGLSPFETSAVLACAAPQLSNAYHRIYAYVHDDLNRLSPSLELIAALASSSLSIQLVNREALAPHGLLCRIGLLHPGSEPANPLHREYSLDGAGFDALTRPGIDWRSRFRDADLVETATALPLEVFPDCEELDRLARLLLSPEPCVIGLWGRAHHGGADAAAALAQASGRMLRRLPPRADETRVAASLTCAEALAAMVWIDTGALPPDHDAARLATLLAERAVTVILTGGEPWRPLELLRQRPFADLMLRAPGRLQRQRFWQASAPDADPRTWAALADLYAFSPVAMRAAVAAAALQDRMSENPGHGAGDGLEQACRTVSLRQASDFARTIVPRRKPDELILPAGLHRRVMEVAAFHRLRPRVDEGWGFGRLLSGGGVKVLMTGDSGTGKTAAAEVIAGEAGRGQPMLKVHLASVVSKWVGETEKNLDQVFQHAEESHAVLFFDEADSLFAKRGEVDKGSDRYANLEVGFLLQRLEDFGGLAILASNHKDQIDEAFMRRFQVVLHFPRPAPPERLRLWRMALPPEAPADPGIDFDLLQKLDLTGAGIVNAARTAALLAAMEDAASIGMAHIVEAVARQFQHEARLLPSAQLGRYAALLEAGK